MPHNTPFVSCNQYSHFRPQPGIPRMHQRGPVVDSKAVVERASLGQVKVNHS